MDSLVDPVAELREDPLLAPVVAPDFDAAKFSREIIGGRVQPKGAEGGAGGAGGSGSTVADVGGGGGVARAAPDEVLRRVGARLRSVDARVRQLVGAHQDDLLAQAGRTRELKEEVDGVAERASDLRARVDSVRESVLGPLAQIRAHADRLERLQEAAGLVRGVMRFQFAVRKLRGVLGDRDAATLDPRELAKASHILMEAEAVLQFGDDGAAGASDEASKGPPKLQGIDVVDRERAWLASTGVGLRERAHELLLASMESLSQADLGSALHIFFELHCLPERVDAAIAHAVDTVKRAAGTAFDVAALAASVGGGGATGRAGDSGAAAGSSGPRSRGSRLPGKLRGNLTPPPGAAPAWRAALWSRVDALLERLYRAAVQAWHLQRVLGKKRDPLTHKRLIDALRVGSEAPGSGSLPPSHVFRRFWSAAAEELRAAVAEAVDGNSFLRNTLVDEYPRLRSLLLTTLARLQRSTEGRSGEVALAAGSGGGAGETSAPGDAGVGGSVWEQDRLLGAASQLLQVFLARSLSRLNEPVAMMFPSLPEGASGAAGGADGAAGAEDDSAGVLADLPSSSDVGVFVKAVAAELRACKGDPGLCSAVVGGVEAAVQTLTSKAARAAATDATATAIASDWAPSRSQFHNCTLLSRLQQANAALESLQVELRNGNGLGVARSVTSVEVGAAVAAALLPARSAVAELMASILQPLAAAVARALEEILARMHRRSFAADAIADRPDAARGKAGPGSIVSSGGNQSGALGGVSPYMSAFEEAVSAAVAGVLADLPACDAVSSIRRAIVSRLFLAFVRHASLIRPLSEDGALALTRDLAHLELAVAPLAPAASAAGYTELRAFRPLLFASTDDVLAAIRRGKGKRATSEQSSAVDSVSAVRPSVLMHHLIGRAPVELRLPHARAGWSPSRYCQWVDRVGVDDHDGERGPAGISGADLIGPRPLLFPAAAEERKREAAIWERIRECLDEYAGRGSGAAAGSDALHAVYRVLVEAGPRLVAQYTRRLLTN